MFKDHVAIALCRRRANLRYFFFLFNLKGDIVIDDLFTLHELVKNRDVFSKYIKITPAPRCLFRFLKLTDIIKNRNDVALCDVTERDFMHVKSLRASDENI